jgi:hypothetical protein
MELEQAFVHSFFLQHYHNSQRVEATQVSTVHEWTKYTQWILRRKEPCHGETCMYSDDIMLPGINELEEGKYYAKLVSRLKKTSGRVIADAFIPFIRIDLFPNMKFSLGLLFCFKPLHFVK